MQGAWDMVLHVFDGWPSLIPDDHTVLETGMVLSLEPGIALSNKIIVHEENINN